MRGADKPRESKTLFPRKEWPRLVKVGSVGVKVYRTRRRRSFLYCVAHHFGGKRIRQNFADERRALLEARKIATKISNAEHELVEITRDDWRLHQLAILALQPFQIPIDVACREYVEARRLLGSSSILDAANLYCETQRERTASKPVPELVAEFIEAKIASGVGNRGTADYRSRLGRFAAAFHCEIGDVTKDQLQAFLNGLKIGLRTKRNFKTALVTLFAYARSKGCLPRDRKTEAEHLDSIEAVASDVAIVSANNFAKLIHAAQAEDPALVPYLAIRAFTGIRDSEINRMDWTNVKLEQGQIEVPASAAKRTRGRRGNMLRRLVPIQTNLRAWLEGCRNQSGSICQYQNCQRIARKLAKKSRIKWVHNGMRHSYGSCRVALTKNYPLVAYEMGNSVEVIKRHYDQVVSENDAQKWFSIVPKSGEGRIPH